MKSACTTTWITWTTESISHPLADNSSIPRVFVVTDPMCSWCWGMSGAVEEAAHHLRGEVELDLLLGGINTHATQSIGEFGRRHLMRLWEEVQATTGANFGFSLPEEFIYNSTVPCVAVEALRRRSGQAPFGFLHRLQQCFFEEGRNISDPSVVGWVAEEFGWSPGELEAEIDDQQLHHAARSQFDSSRNYGTSALPNVIVEEDGERRLLFGGYADSEMIVSLVRGAFATAGD